MIRQLLDPVCAYLTEEGWHDEIVSDCFITKKNMMESSLLAEETEKTYEVEARDVEPHVGDQGIEYRFSKVCRNTMVTKGCWEL